MGCVGSPLPPLLINTSFFHTDTTKQRTQYCTYKNFYYKNSTVIQSKKLAILFQLLYTFKKEKEWMTPLWTVTLHW